MSYQSALKLRKKLSQKEFSPGIWLQLPSPAECEVVAGSDFDWVIVDTEHMPFTSETLMHMLMAFKGSETVTLARVPENNEVFVKRMLDMGWDGVLLPQVNTVEDAHKAARACRYPPLGKRGFGPIRAGNYGRNEEEYVRAANEAVICAIQIEDVIGADHIEEIVKIPGIDWIMVGPNDMSGSTDRFQDRQNPVLVQAIKRIFKTAQAAGIPTSTGGGSIKDMNDVIDMGCQLVFLGTDTDYLKDSAEQAIKAFRERTRK
jgi:2-keto-3-deoxy-L-rhamnonate aldolase RhmA